MTRRRTMQFLFAAIGLMSLIFDSQCALEGTRSGIELCIRTVIPSLFPFLVLSTILTTSMSDLDSSIIRRLSAMMKIPSVAAPVLIPAFLGGYPVGAKCTAELYNNGTLVKQDAERLLAFCSNAGPSFLFGMVSVFFPDKRMIWQLWLIHIFGAVCTGIIYPVSAQQDKKSSEIHRKTRNDDLMISALKAMGIICGWVILFRIVITFMNDWVLLWLPPWLQVLAIGILELSNGCCELIRIQNINIRFIICSCILSLGGICVLFQTVSVTKGLSLRHYYIGKLIQTMFSLLMSSAVAAKMNFLILIAILILLILLKGKIKGRNLEVYPV